MNTATDILEAMVTACQMLYQACQLWKLIRRLIRRHKQRLPKRDN